MLYTEAKTAAVNFPVPPVTPLDKLKLAAAYLSLKKALRNSARYGVGWGLFSVAMGVISRPQTLSGYVWFALGLLLLMQGVWILGARAIDPRMLLSEAFVLLTLGLWNTAGIYLTARMGGRPILGGHAFLWGILQLLSAFPTYKSYAAYQLICRHLDAALVEELEEVTRGLWKSKPGGISDVVVLKKPAVLGSGERLVVKLMPEYLVLLHDKGRALRISGKSEVVVTSVLKKLASRSLKFAFSFDGEEFKTEIKPADLERLKTWVPLAFQGVGQLPLAEG